jgi:hypothetical protein
MLIINNTREPRVFGYQVKPGIPGKDNQPGIPPEIANVTLLPGCNEVDPAAWAELKKNQAVRQLLETEYTYPGEGGTVYSHQNILEVDETVSLKDIRKIEPRKAAKIARNTFDRVLLRNWQRVETRDEVANAIDKQLGAVSPHATKPTEDDEEEEERLTDPKAAAGGKR